MGLASLQRLRFKGFFLDTRGAAGPQPPKHPPGSATDWHDQDDDQGQGWQWTLLGWSLTRSKTTVDIAPLTWSRPTVDIAGWHDQGHSQGHSQGQGQGWPWTLLRWSLTIKDDSGHCSVDMIKAIVKGKGWTVPCLKNPSAPWQHDLELCFANKHVMSLPGGRETLINYGLEGKQYYFIECLDSWRLTPRYYVPILSCQTGTWPVRKLLSELFSLTRLKLTIYPGEDRGFTLYLPILSLWPIHDNSTTWATFNTYVFILQYFSKRCAG